MSALSLRVATPKRAIVRSMEAARAMFHRRKAGHGPATRHDGLPRNTCCVIRHRRGVAVTTAGRFGPKAVTETGAVLARRDVPGTCPGVACHFPRLLCLEVAAHV